MSIAMGSLSEAEQKSQLRRAVVASTIGTSIEWYDFFVYGTAAGLVFPKLFFPGSDPLTGSCNRSASTPSVSWRGRWGRRFLATTATASGARRR